MVLMSYFSAMRPKRLRNCWLTMTAKACNAPSTSKRKMTSLTSQPRLKTVPALPFVGSLVSAYSKAPTMTPETIREWMLEMRLQYGDFFVMGFPGFGEGIYGKLYVVSDPNEYKKVIQREGTHPSGLVESLWPFIRRHRETNFVFTRGDNNGFFGRGEDWRRIRNFLHSGLLSPQAAAGYMPGILEAAELASRGAPHCSDDLNDYLNRSAFDMFSAVLLGELTQVADPTAASDPVNEKFVTYAAKSLDSTLLSDPYEVVMGKMLKLNTTKYNEMVEANRIIEEIAITKSEAFRTKFRENALDEFQRNSYLAHALRRQAEQPIDCLEEDKITDEWIDALVYQLLSPAVDTTSGVLAWALLNLSLNVDVQDKLYSELKINAVCPTTGRLIPEAILKQDSVPYLYATIRESHRLTPTLVTGMVKQVSEDLEIHDHTIPAKSKVLFNSYPIQMDASYVEDPDDFRPERWLAKNVEARLGTPRALIDHSFFQDPFSQGSRRCPGSRVARNEILCFLAQLILDYRISILPASSLNMHDSDLKSGITIKSYKDVPYRWQATLTPLLPPMEFQPRN